MNRYSKQCPSVEELQQYFAREISDKQAKIIAEHVEDCISCTDIMESLEEAATEETEISEKILQDVYFDQNFEEIPMPESLVAALKTRESLLARIIKTIKKQAQSAKNVVISILLVIRGWLEIPMIKPLVPIAAVVLLAIFLLPKFFFQPSKYADLAIIKKAPYQAIKFKGDIELTRSQQLFADGMKFYNQKKYQAAIQKLTTFLEDEPDNAYGNFYLGVSYILANDIENGIEFLKQASEFSQELTNKLLLEQCHWYLGNGYLKTNDVEPALIEFKNVIKLNGEFKHDAEKQVKKIEKMKQKKARN